MNTLNRRKFLSSSALLATSSLISVTANAACKDPMPAKWDEEVDVIVVGSGFAGLAAAAEAKNANAGNVIVLEKMRAPGGNSVINGGIFAVPGNPAQVKLGIKDSPELLASDMIAAGLGYGYPEKIKAMTEEALPTYEWTVKELGVQYNDKVGHSVPRHVSAINNFSISVVGIEKTGKLFDCFSEIPSVNVHERSQAVGKCTFGVGNASSGLLPVGKQSEAIFSSRYGTRNMGSVCIHCLAELRSK